MSIWDNACLFPGIWSWCKLLHLISCIKGNQKKHDTGSPSSGVRKEHTQMTCVEMLESSASIWQELYSVIH